MTVIRVELPDDVAAALGASDQEIAAEVRRAAALRWCADGRISRRQAAAVAGVGREEIDAALETAGPAAQTAPEGRPGRRFILTLFGSPAVREVVAGGRKAGPRNAGPRNAGPREVEVVWRLRKAFQSVAFLALAPDQRATKEELIDAVWPEASDEAIRKNFHPTLSEARRALQAGDAIVFRQGSYRLNPEHGWEVDALRFEELAAAGRELVEGAGEGAEARAVELWRRAWRLYRGPLLAELDRDWVAPRRETLRRTYLRVLRGLGRLGVGLGRQTLALDAYRSVLLEEPYEERIHLAMMELYARQGRRDLVRRQYVKLQELLAKELNVEPMEETQERYHQLMR